ncbi:MAG: hypothetical protein AB8H79_24795 [Myxococcota bacterium]
MTPAALRRWMLGITAVGLAGTPVDLALTGHYGSPPQIIPFVLCGLGLIAVIVAAVRPMKPTIWALRGVMGLVVAGSLFGVWEHIEHNAEFTAEILPNASGLELAADVLTGANPILAPLALLLLATLGIASTWRQVGADGSGPAD